MMEGSFKALSKQRSTATFSLIPAAGYPRIGPKSNIQHCRFLLEVPYHMQGQ
jgi:hypothetical protein